MAVFFKSRPLFFGNSPGLFPIEKPRRTYPRLFIRSIAYLDELDVGKERHKRNIFRVRTLDQDNWLAKGRCHSSLIIHLW